MKLISPNMLAKLRRGAEQEFLKHRDSLMTATALIKCDMAKELGIPFKAPKVEPVLVAGAESIGLFDDEPESKTVMPTAMVRVKLTDYIDALKKYKPDGPANPNSNSGQAAKS